MVKRKSTSSSGGPKVHRNLFDSKNVIWQNKESYNSDEGEKVESVQYLVLTGTFVELYQFYVATKNGRRSPSYQMHDRQRLKLVNIESMATLKRKNKRALRIKTDRRVTIYESAKFGRSPWEETKEMAYCIEFEGKPDEITNCRRKITAAKKMLES